MTREEKIELLEKEKAYMIGHGGDRQAKALDSTIKALKQEAVLDKIRAEIEAEKLGYPPSAGYYKAIIKVLQIIDKYKKEHGIFALFSSRESDPEKGLALYRKRGEIESAFRVHNEDLKGDMPGCSLDTVFEGKTFVQFVSLILQEALITRVNEMKRTLGVPTGDEKHDLKVNLDAEKRLKAWLEDRSIKRILNWFDTNDKIIVSNKMKIKRWNSEVIARDKLFLSKLGISITN